MHRTERGFTLTELVVAMALVGVLTMIAVAYAGERRAGAKAFTDQISGELETVRLRAMSTRRWHRVTVTEGGISIEQATTTGMAAPVAYEWIGRATAPAGVRIVALSTSTQVAPGSQPADGTGFSEELRFAPDGASVPRTLWISDARDKVPQRIAVFGATGRARVYEGW
jgi:prepilin-type N-terminal cleavage/methylation domain-containing protein